MNIKHLLPRATFVCILELKASTILLEDWVSQRQFSGWFIWHFANLIDGNLWFVVRRTPSARDRDSGPLTHFNLPPGEWLLCGWWGLCVSESEYESETETESESESESEDPPATKAGAQSLLIISISNNGKQLPSADCQTSVAFAFAFALLLLLLLLPLKLLSWGTNFYCIAMSTVVAAAIVIPVYEWVCGTIALKMRIRIWNRLRMRIVTQNEATCAPLAADTDTDANCAVPLLLRVLLLLLLLLQHATFN